MAQPRNINLDEQARAGSCTTDILADHCVTSVKLAAGAVSGASLADGSVTSAKLDIDANVDFHNFQALDFRIENLGSDPLAGNPGRLIWRTDSMEIHVDNGSAFVPITSGGGSGANTSLSNLVSTAINASLLPNANDTFNLGSISLVWDTAFVRQIISDTGTITSSGNLQLDGNFAVESASAILFNGLGDTNWQIGRNLNAFTMSTISTSYLQVVVDGGFGQGFAIGAAGGSSYLEFNEVGNGYLRNNLSLGGDISVAGFTLRTSPTAGYVLTSDSAGNGTWQSATAGTVQYAKDFVTVSSPISDHTITLSHTPIANSEVVIWQGIVLTSHSGLDYTIIGNVVTLDAGITLTVGDELQVVYSY